MRPELQTVLNTSMAARDALIAGKMGVKEANAIGQHNHVVVSVFVLLLRERMYLAEERAREGINRPVHPEAEAGVKRPTPRGLMRELVAALDDNQA